MTEKEMENLILINAAHPIVSLPAHLVPFSRDFPHITLAPDAARALHEALSAVGAEGRIVPVSGFRSIEEQKEIYFSSLKENGAEYTESFVALPRASEHHSGLAVDLALNEGEIDFICPRFPYEGICQTFREIAPQFGFIERYKADKRQITGIAAEEWHFRYVGTPHAAAITRTGLCLEEYLDRLKAKEPSIGEGKK